MKKAAREDRCQREKRKKTELRRTDGIYIKRTTAQKIRKQQKLKTIRKTDHQIQVNDNKIWEGQKTHIFRTSYTTQRRKLSNKQWNANKKKTARNIHFQIQTQKYNRRGSWRGQMAHNIPKLR